MSCYGQLEKLRRIFSVGVEAVKPGKVFCGGKWLKISTSSDGNRETLRVGGESFDLTGKRCHLIGFGKAVLGMAVQVERILAHRLVSGVISVPIGTGRVFENVDGMKLRFGSVVSVHEGAQDNLPDEKSLGATFEIRKIAKSMTPDDILFVLISGGGSALLPMPVTSLSLEEKTELIRNLSRRGATIQELNSVRIALSEVKGGKLANDAKNAHRIISFVISDVIGDPLDLIASGPTVPFNAPVTGYTAVDVLKKYEVQDERILALAEDSVKDVQVTNASTHIIANNKIAASKCLQEAQKLGYSACVLSTSIQGNVDTLAREYTAFLVSLRKFIAKELSADAFVQSYPFDKDTVHTLLEICENLKKGQCLCLILGGEPTVRVTGNGKGGRSQELALRMSLELHKNGLECVSFLSAGTDGIDGPTDAAGALGSSQIVRDYLTSGGTLDDLNSFIQRNDSYNFFKSFSDGRAHIVTGHTGTNVMDIHLMLIDN